MWWLYIITSIQFVIVVIGLGFIFKKIYFTKSPDIIVKNDNIESSVKCGIKNALRELEFENQQEKQLIRSLDKNTLGFGVFSSNNKEEEPILTGGDLIPSNLSDSEKEILRMFYNQ